MGILEAFINGLLGLFLQPLFYLFLAFAAIVPLRRVWAERRQFSVRTYSVVDEWLGMIKPGLIFGLIGSVVFLLFGIVLPEGMLILLAVCYVLSMLLLSTRIVTPLFAVGAAILAAYFMPDIQTGVRFLDQWLVDLQHVSFAALVAMLGLLLIIEAELIRLWGVRRTTPKRLKSRRGKIVGAQEAKRFWLVPLFVLLPAGALPRLHGWPILVEGPESFSVLLVPFGFGFYRLIVDDLPERVHLNQALLSMLMGVAILLSALVGWYTEMVEIPIMVTIAAIALRIITDIWRSLKWRHAKYFYPPRDDGLTVLSVLPRSPAAKMGIAIGECLYRVNGHRLENQEDVYTALQDNAAYCRLEVIDTAGEKRIVQTALYEGSHHELGLLFVT